MSFGKPHGKYLDPDGSGQEWPSVTKILDRVKNKEALLYWANKVGRGDPGDPDAGIPPKPPMTLQEARKPAASAGSIAHDMVECHIKEKVWAPEPGIVIPAEILAKAKVSFAAYLNWDLNTKITISKEHLELELYSKVHKFAGRLDAIGFDAMGRLCILDWKTSDSFYGDMKWQLGAYSILWEENYPDHPLSGGAHLCRFDKNDSGFSHHQWPELNQQKEDFIEYRKTYDRLIRMDKAKS